MSEDGGGASGWARPGWGEPAASPQQPGWGEAPPSPQQPGWSAPPPGAPPYGWAPGGWPEPAPQPGVVPLRPLGLGEILDGAITTVRRHPRLTIGLAAAVATARQLVSAVIAAVTGNVSGSVLPASGGGFRFGLGGATGITDLFRTGSVIGAAVELVVGAVLGALLTGMLVVVVSEAVLGRGLQFGELWERVRPRFWALVGASLLSGLLPFAGVPVAALAGAAVGLTVGAAAGTATGVLAGIVLLIVPGAVFWGLFALTAPALMLERIGPAAALRRSWQLARPDFFRVWGIRALATIIAAVITGVIAVPFSVVAFFVVAANGSGSLAGGSLAVLIAVSAIGGIVGGAIVEPFVSGVLALLYIDRRIRGEGLDIALAQAARAGTSPAAADPA